MKTKSIVKYYLYEVIPSFIVFYGIMLLALIATLIGYRLSGGKIYTSGIELASIIFLFVLGLNLFKSQFYFLIQNGVSRKANLIGFIVSTFIVIIFAIIDTFSSVIMHNLIGYESFYNILYSSTAQSYGLIYILNSTLFLTVMYGASLMLGYFITTLYYAMNKAMKIIVSVGVPVFLFIGLPIIEFFLNVDIGGKIVYIILNMLGIYDGSTNILYPVLSCIAIYIVLSLFVYLLTRKISVKE